MKCKTEQDLKETEITGNNIYDFQGVEVICNSNDCQGLLVPLELVETMFDNLELRCPACGEAYARVTSDDEY
ncbi:hypothetical protein JCM19239_5825 [Vibrio variabilis]|uniref:Uncharacterized protein n=1 Tax=Vibrio variabilis TaxID=990271 RepID=A0ABQ0J8A9_9VIBR|nr:hypothetical protein JCM19239_5825 [Vibrio variabilis]